MGRLNVNRHCCPHERQRYVVLEGLVLTSSQLPWLPHRRQRGDAGAPVFETGRGASGFVDGAEAAVVAGWKAAGSRFRVSAERRRRSAADWRILSDRSRNKAARSISRPATCANATPV